MKRAEGKLEMRDGKNTGPAPQIWEGVIMGQT